VDACNDLKAKMDEAWARGQTDLMDFDPVQIVEPTVQELAAGITVNSSQDYAIDLWRTWLQTYGITAKENWTGFKTRTDETRSHTVHREQAHG
jgi:hypothetical protein